MSGGSALLPAWIVAPLAAVLMLMIAGHVSALRAAGRGGEQPWSRVRIRTANGLVMMGVVALLATGLSLIPVSNARLFALVWSAVIGLLGIMLALGLIDAMNNIRLTRRARARLRGDFSRVLRHTAEPRDAQG